MTMIATRAQAKAAGLTHYFTGKPCLRGHVDLRFTSIGKCAACAREDSMKQYVHTTSKRRKVVDTETMIAAAMSVHGDRFSYAKAVFTGAKVPVIVTCALHGDFLIRPDNLIHGKGCKTCMALGVSARCNAGTEGFISKATAIYGDKFDYSLVEYIDSHTKVRIVCNPHGEFQQTPTNHLTGKSGCTKCNHMKSRGEAAVASALSIFTKVIQRDHECIKPKELDIFLPEKNIAVEYCGEYWHSHGDAVDEANKSINHYNKFKACADAGVRLITLYESEWINRNYAVRRLLRNAAGSSRGKLMARKCALQKVSVQEAREFYERYHPQGGNGAGEHYGLYWNAKLVACMRFTLGANDRGNNKNRVWTLTRYATRVTVAGGASRLFKAFVNEYNPAQVKSFSDNRFFGGGMYAQLGFALVEESKPDYAVWHSKLGLLPKSHYQRRVLPARAEELGLDIQFDPETDPRTEKDITYLLGGRRIYDCGKKRWVWSRQ
jgi:hypothetical protein